MPWLDDLEPLRRPFLAAEFGEHARGLAVEQVVYVQVDTTPAYGFLEAQWAVTQAPLVGGVVAWAPMEDGSIVGSYLDALVGLGPRIKGVRRLLQSEPSPEFLIQPGLITGLRLLPQFGLSFDICIRHDQLARTIEMVRACPETQFVLDHLGKPSIISRSLEPWREQISELAEFPNVVCKVSGVVTEADQANWILEDLKPFVAHVLLAFGEDRVLFGGDWPVVTLAASYRRWVETLDQLTSTLSPAARQKLWADNARRVYRL
jgi:predicted TIM-barrel fold metal-dependent hydrolase